MVEVEDLKYGGTLRAFFDEKTHLLAAVEQPLGPDTCLRDTYLDYRSSASALASHTVERQRLERDGLGRWYPVGMPRWYSITYNALSDDLFELSERMPGWEGLDAFEMQGTLWVKVIFTKQQIEAVGVLPGAESQLTAIQKDLIEQQIAEAVVDDISGRSLFARVLALPKTGIGNDFETGEYLLEIELKRINKITPKGIIKINLYFARFSDVVSHTVIMQDGPPNATYYFTHIPRGRKPKYLGCLDYRLTFFGVEDDVAYMGQNKLSKLISRTYQKLAIAVKAYEKGAWHPYNDECCYCQPP